MNKSPLTPAPESMRSSPMSPDISVGIVMGSISRKSGGVMDAVRKYAQYLANDNLTIDVYSGFDEYTSADIEKWSPINPITHKIGWPRSLGYLYNLNYSLMHSNHDLVHLHGIWQLYSWQISRFSQTRGVPVIISPHGMLDEWAIKNSRHKKNLALALYERANLRRASCLHALNESEYNSIRSFGLKNPVSIISNGSDLPEISNLNTYRCSNDLKNVIYIGRIHEKKGILSLINAWAIFLRKAPSFRNIWRLKIAGWDDGGYLSVIKSEIKRLNLENHIELVGPLFGKQKERFFREASIFILPSLSEGLPMTVLEAWSYNLPVMMTKMCNLPIGFDMGAAIEITTDPQQIATALITTIGYSDLDLIGKNGRELVKTQFYWPEIAQKHKMVYEWLSRKGPKPEFVF